MPTPSISVVIPTCGRPQLVRRAAESALAQTFRDLEVVVVPADRDEETQRCLANVSDERLRVLPYAGQLNASASRNRGVQHARGRWIAFLDDDDYWLPDKLRLQQETALRSVFSMPIVSCGMLARDGYSERLWPTTVPHRNQPIGDYLFRRRTLWGAAGFLQTSTLFAPRELLVEVPFSDEFHPVEDLDWVLRAVRHENVGVEFVVNGEGTHPMPLIVWNIDTGRPRESLSHGWKRQLEWIRANRYLVGPEAYASYVLTWVSLDAAREKAGIREFLELWREAARNGRPSLLDLAVHLGHWLVPYSSLNRLSGWVTGTRAGNR